MRAGHGARAVQRPGERAVEHVLDERALAAAADAGDGGERAERNRDVDVLADCCAGRRRSRGKAESGEPERGRSCRLLCRLCAFAFRLLRLGRRLAIRRFVGTGIAFLPLKIRPRDASRVACATCSGVPRATICAAAVAGAGAEVEQIDRRSAITSRSCSTTSSVLPRSRSLCSALEQPRVVARMQADRRFVEHVQHAAQAAADLAGQADALRFAAGERRRRRGRASGSRGRRRRRNCSRLLISRSSSPAILLLARRQLPGRRISRCSSPSGMRQISSIVRSRNRTAAASSRSRLPPHVEQSTSPTRCSSRARKRGESRDGFFERRVEALVLEAEAQPAPSLPAFASLRLRLSPARRSTPRPCRAASIRRCLAVELLERHVERNAACRGQAPRASRANSGCARSGHSATRPLGERQLRIAQQRRRIRAGLRRPALRTPGTSRADC